MSFGVEGSEETNANFHLGPSAGVVINKSWFMGLAEDKGGDHVRQGDEGRL